MPTTDSYHLKCDFGTLRPDAMFTRKVRPVPTHQMRTLYVLPIESNQLNQHCATLRSDPVRSTRTVKLIPIYPFTTNVVSGSARKLKLHYCSLINIHEHTYSFFVFNSHRQIWGSAVSNTLTCESMHSSSKSQSRNRRFVDRRRLCHIDVGEQAVCDHL
jgi:hypothetical protein